MTVHVSTPRIRFVGEPLPAEALLGFAQKMLDQQRQRAGRTPIVFNALTPPESDALVLAAKRAVVVHRTAQQLYEATMQEWLGEIHPQFAALTKATRSFWIDRVEAILSACGVAEFNALEPLKTSEVGAAYRHYIVADEARS